MFSWFILSHLLAVIYCYQGHLQQPPPPPSAGPNGAGPRAGSHGPPGPPSFYEESPHEFRNVLSPELFTRLQAIHRDISLNWQQRQAEIEILMNALPGNVTQKLPVPGNLNKLPAKVRKEVEGVLRNTTVSWKNRKEAIHTILKSLSTEQRQAIEPLPLILQAHGPSPTAFVCPGTENMTGELRAKLEAAGKLQDCLRGSS